MCRVSPVICCLCLFLAGDSAKASVGETADYRFLFEEICSKVEDNFYNTSFIDNDFPAVAIEHKKAASSASTPGQFSDIINTMLSRLNASHTRYYTPRDYEYHHLASIFHELPDMKKRFPEEILYTSVGIITDKIDSKYFIVSVLSGSAAEKAGLLRGDEVVAVNGKPYSPITSIDGYAGKSVEFEIRRSKEAATHVFELEPIRINPRKEMLYALKKSIKVTGKKGMRIGYIHYWSYAGEEYHQILKESIMWGMLRDADALIWDLRYGFGGANPEYLNIFNTKVPVLTRTDGKGRKSKADPQWRKPVVMLANSSVRSGKELLAYGFKKYKLGTIIGEKTAGAVLGGKLFPLSNGALLYLASESVSVDGTSLEGKGVEPDIVVPQDARYSEGRDSQLDRAIEYLRDELGNKHRTDPSSMADRTRT